LISVDLRSSNRKAVFASGRSPNLIQKFKMKNEKKKSRCQTTTVVVGGFHYRFVSGERTIISGSDKNKKIGM
jgi:hypothetical protein